MDTDHRKPFDVPWFLASQLIFQILTIPAFIPRPARIITLAVLGWYSYRVIFTQTTGNFKNDFGIGTTLLAQYLASLDFALLTPPENLKDFHDKNRTTVTQRPFKQRLIWAVKRIWNPRCIGLANEAPHLPPHWPSPSVTRSRFVFSKILLATCCSVGSHFCHRAYASMTTADKLVTAAPFHWRMLAVLFFGLGTIFSISSAQAIVSAGMVGCGFSSPERWPLMFGSPLQVWSIARFWKRFWHQMLRSYLLTCTSSILGCFFPANYVGTTGYKLARLYLVFFISGVLHTGGDVMATGKLGFKSFTFFMLQPFGITIEMIVSYLWRRLQHDQSNPHKTTVNGDQPKHSTNKNGKSLPEEPIPPVWVRCVGYIWVTLWMVWTGAYIVDALFAARLLFGKPGQV